MLFKALKCHWELLGQRHLLGLLCSALGSDPLINPCHGSDLGCSAAFQVMGSDPECRGQLLGWKCPLEGR